MLNRSQEKEKRKKKKKKKKSTEMGTNSPKCHFS